MGEMERRGRHLGGRPGPGRRSRAPSAMGHSIDFHSARIPWNEAYKNIDPGEELTFE